MAGYFEDIAHSVAGIAESCIGQIIDGTGARLIQQGINFSRALEQQTTGTITNVHYALVRLMLSRHVVMRNNIITRLAARLNLGIEEHRLNRRLSKFLARNIVDYMSHHNITTLSYEEETEIENMVINAIVETHTINVSQPIPILGLSLSSPELDIIDEVQDTSRLRYAISHSLEQARQMLIQRREEREQDVRLADLARMHQDVTTKDLLIMGLDMQSDAPAPQYHFIQLALRREEISDWWRRELRPEAPCGQRTITLLLGFGLWEANFIMIDRGGYAAIHWAAEWGYSNIIRMFAAAGADLNHYSAKYHPTHAALRGIIKRGDGASIEPLRTLLRLGSNPNAFHLHEHGENVSLPGIGQTALHYVVNEAPRGTEAEQVRFRELISLLCHYGADPLTPNAAGQRIVDVISPEEYQTYFGVAAIAGPALPLVRRIAPEAPDVTASIAPPGTDDVASQPTGATSSSADILAASRGYTNTLNAPSDDDEHEPYLTEATSSSSTSVPFRR